MKKLLFFEALNELCLSASFDSLTHEAETILNFIPSDTGSLDFWVDQKCFSDHDAF